MLHHAADQGHYPAMVTLLNHGADARMPELRGFSPLDVCVFRARSGLRDHLMCRDMMQAYVSWAPGCTPITDEEFSDLHFHGNMMAIYCSHEYPPDELMGEDFATPPPPHPQQQPQPHPAPPTSSASALAPDGAAGEDFAKHLK